MMRKQERFLWSTEEKWKWRKSMVDGKVDGWPGALFCREIPINPQKHSPCLAYTVCVCCTCAFACMCVYMCVTQSVMTDLATCFLPYTHTHIKTHLAAALKFVASSHLSADFTSTRAPWQQDSSQTHTHAPCHLLSLWAWPINDVIFQLFLFDFKSVNFSTCCHGRLKLYIHLESKMQILCICV